MKKLLFAVTLLSVAGINASATGATKNKGNTRVGAQSGMINQLQAAKLKTVIPGYFLMNVPQSTGALAPQYYRYYTYTAIIGGFVNDAGGLD